MTALDKLVRDALPNPTRRDQRRLAFAKALCVEYPRMLELSKVPPDTCILAVHFGMDVAQELGYRTRAMPVQVVASNRQAAAIRAKGLEPHDADAKVNGALEIWLGYTPARLHHDRDMYNGHLIFLVDDKLAVDLTAHQLARPEAGLTITPLYFPVERAFVRGEQGLGLLAEPGDGWQVNYMPRPDDHSWASHTDFDAQHHQGMRQMAREMARLLERRHGVKPATTGRK